MMLEKCEVHCWRLLASGHGSVRTRILLKEAANFPLRPTRLNAPAMHPADMARSGLLLLDMEWDVILIQVLPRRSYYTTKPTAEQDEADRRWIATTALFSHAIFLVFVSTSKTTHSHSELTQMDLAKGKAKLLQRGANHPDNAQSNGARNVKLAYC